MSHAAVRARGTRRLVPKSMLPNVTMVRHSLLNLLLARPGTSTVLHGRPWSASTCGACPFWVHSRPWLGMVGDSRLQVEGFGATKKYQEKTLFHPRSPSSLTLQ